MHLEISTGSLRGPEIDNDQPPPILYFNHCVLPCRQEPRSINNNQGDSLNNNQGSERTTFCRHLIDSNLSDVRNPFFWRGILAEVMGVFFLVLIGCGSCLTLGDQGPNEVQIALTFGIAVAIIVGFTAHVSGGLLNPAVAIGKGLSQGA